MRILAKLTLDCDDDAAWRALHSPQAMAELYAPVMRMDSVKPLPTSWTSGDDTVVRLRLAGALPIGRQLLALTDSEQLRRGVRVRILRDAGIPLSGPTAALDVWDHQIAVSAAGAGRTLWRERLVFGGTAAPALWAPLWALWQWRSIRLRRLAPTWAHDPSTGQH